MNCLSVPRTFVARVKGNQVEFLNDPVTVSVESSRRIPLRMREKGGCLGMRESGNLLRGAVHSFRRKRVAPDGRSKCAFAQHSGVCFRREGRRFLFECGTRIRSDLPIVKHVDFGLFLNGPDWERTLPHECRRAL